MKYQLIASCGIACLLVGCQPATKTVEPSRPAQVPAAAVWVGGSDGGAFIDCRLESGSQDYDCRVYNDHTGELWASGRFRSTTPSPTFDPHKVESYGGFDGTRILLAGHGTLEKIPPPKLHQPLAVRLLAACHEFAAHPYQAQKLADLLDGEVISAANLKGPDFAQAAYFNDAFSAKHDSVKGEHEMGRLMAPDKLPSPAIGFCHMSQS